jgi:hypothetical protein
MAGNDDVLERLKPKPNPKVVKALEDLLQQAYKGEIRSIAVAYIQPDATYHGSWSFWSEQRDHLSLVGALQVCQHLILNQTRIAAPPAK